MTSKPDKSKSGLIREQPLTYDDYAALDDGNRYELLGGKLELMSPAPTIKHQVISFEMQKRMASTCELEYLILYSPVDLILSATDVCQPDLVMIHRTRLDILSARGIEGIPDLVVEIVSPSSLKRDKLRKLKLYAASGIPEYWIVDPAGGTLEQHMLYEGRYDLCNIYIGDESVRSERIACLSFTMEDIMNSIPDLPDR